MPVDSSEFDNLTLTLSASGEGRGEVEGRVR